MRISPDPLIAGAGGVLTITASESGGSITTMDMTSENTLIATVNSPASRVGSSGTFLANAQGVAAGATRMTATATIVGAGPGNSASCSRSLDVTVENPVPWFRVIGGDVISGGGVTSLISEACINNPDCPDQFILYNEAGYPGTVVHGSGTPDFQSGNSYGIVSGDGTEFGWINSANYGGSEYSFENFEKMIPSSYEINPIHGSAIGGGELTGAGSVNIDDGYHWYRKNGDTTINGNVNISDRKVVLVVNGNLFISADITLNNPESDFFMVIVKGNIEIDPKVTRLEGIFFAEGNCETGTEGEEPAEDEQLAFLGLLSCGSRNSGGISLQRNLGAENINTAAELFEFSPGLILNYPKTLNIRRVSWKEVVP